MKSRVLPWNPIVWVVLFLANVSAFAGPEAPIPPTEKFDTRILRDEWGVPHIFGKTDADVAYGLGFVHGEDDWTNAEIALLSGRGEAALAFGPDYAQSDYLVRFFRVREFVDAKYEQDLSAEVRAVIEAYAEGLTHFATLHPEKMPNLKLPIAGKDIVARTTFLSPFIYMLERDLAQLFANAPGIPPSNRSIISALPKPATNSMKDMDAGIWRERMAVGSNAWAVGPTLSADGFTRLAVNSHMPWAGAASYYEAHLHSEQGWDMVGATMAGGPLVLMGHDLNKGWAHTINRPDLVDIYALEANPDNPNQYRFDDTWRDLERATIKIEVGTAGKVSDALERELLWSVHGPVVRRPDGLFAIRFAGYGDVGHLEQWYRMNKARNLDEFLNALRLLKVPSLNTVYADKGGNVFYVYGGRIPMRAEGYDWSGLVPGNTSKTLWTEVYPFDRLPQILNPATGFVQNCNSTPFRTMTGEGNPDPASFPKSMGVEGHDTNRSRRARDLHGGDTSITREEFYAYKHDKTCLQGSDVMYYLDRLFKEEIPQEPVLQDAIKLLKEWDHSFDKESRAAALAYLVGWPHGRRDAWAGTPPNPVNVLRQATSVLMKHYGRLDVPWKEVLRIRHGKVDVGVSGGPDCLRALYSELTEDGHLAGMAGDCHYQMVEWDQEGRLRAEVISSFGNAPADENSPHYADQAPLFAEEKLRPTWMNEAEIRNHLKREYRPGEGGYPWYAK